MSSSPIGRVLQVFFAASLMTACAHPLKAVYLPGQNGDPAQHDAVLADEAERNGDEATARQIRHRAAHERLEQKRNRSPQQFGAP